MILVDANLLLYAYDQSSVHHHPSKTWWVACLSGHEPIRIAWVTILAFIRIGTHSRVFAQPLSIDEANAAVITWLSRPMIGIATPGERHWPILDKLLRKSQASGNLVTDAHLAALAIEHGCTLCSTDQDFRRFDGLTWINPISTTH